MNLKNHYAFAAKLPSTTHWSSYFVPKSLDQRVCSCPKNCSVIKYIPERNTIWMIDRHGNKNNNTYIIPIFLFE